MMPKPKPQHLYSETTRHGRLVWYVRKGHGPRTRLTADYDTAQFWEQYNAALAGTPMAPKGARGKAPQTLGWAIDLYRRSPEWSELARETRRRRDFILQSVGDSAGHIHLRHIDKAEIRKGRDRRSDTPHAANDFLKTMRSFFAWAVAAEHVTDDPTDGIPRLRGGNDAVGFHTWTEEELTRFESCWPLGSRQRLAFDLMLYTGLRRGDAVTAGRQHVRDGVLTIRTEKTGEPVFVTILPPLAASIEATKTGDLTFLVTEHGRPFSKAGFGNWFRDACRKAGCPGAAHGLRKAGATRAAENGATERQLMAMFGWSSGKMASHYTRAADRKRLSAESAGLLLKGQPGNKSPRTSRKRESRTFGGH